MKVTLKKINKSFGKIRILKDIDFEIESGEIHALMGENGAGKSTMIKVLTGVYTKDSGTILIDDQVVNIKKISDSQTLKIAYVHQELNVVKEMSVLENMFLGNEIKYGIFSTNEAEMKRICEEKLKLLDIDIDVKTKMKSLTVGFQQMVEIAKSLIHDASLIILDEPSAALTNKEIDNLFKVIKNLQKHGKSFLYVSHRMDEIFSICERVSVLRDGEYIGTRKVKDTTIDLLVEMMVGRSLDNLIFHEICKTGKKVLEVENLSRTGEYNDISFDLHEGEILGFSGLMGSGRTEIMHAIFGSKKPMSGIIKLDGVKVNVATPLVAKKHGIAFVTEDRKEEGLILDFDVKENIVIPSLKRMLKGMFLDDKKMIETTQESIDNLNIKTNSYLQKVKNLSGGNQQKVVFAKWLNTNPRILILDEPTRGVDVGAKKEIYTIINNLKKNGVAIIIVSSELPELIGICDRITVMHQGNLVHIFDDQQSFSQEEILRYSFVGGKT